MRVDLFDFELPEGRIADRPAVPRDNARLLHVGRSGLRDLRISDLPTLLHTGDTVVLNDTRVIPARLLGRRGVVPIEFLLHRRIAPDAWQGFAKPGKRLKVGQVVEFPQALTGEVMAKDAALVTLRFNRSGDALTAAFERVGHVPLPPYIRRADDASDRRDYQTMHAAKPGAVAAPTAGLHMTPALVGALDAKGVTRTYVTLHVGAGTFLPVNVEDTRDHVMHAEWGEIGAAAATELAATRAGSRRIVAVGTTSLRLMESAAAQGGTIGPFSGETSLFITPGYRFKTADMLLTNFHLPRSTLFMLVCAFAGIDTARAAYAHAIAEGYRFYSYGDACLFERAP
ncbi:MAG: tRNA preQ1(34) S-adenosylmethionine ribosyltransferase-isomerase QueA [Rhodospirillaceae bacterium]